MIRWLLVEIPFWELIALALLYGVALGLYASIIWP
jgi:hypothetical protein